MELCGFSYSISSQERRPTQDVNTVVEVRMSLATGTERKYKMQIKNTSLALYVG